MALKQLTHSQADMIADRLGQKAIGFAFAKAGKHGISEAAVRQIASDAVYITLREMGHLDASQARDAAATSRAADAAAARHNAWKRATGMAC